MRHVLMLPGDVNLMNVTDPKVPFALIGDTLRQADVLFGNLECCFHEPGAGHSIEGGGFPAIGNANNVNYGEEAIRSSLRELERVGIPCTGAGVNSKAARAPVIVTRRGLRFGFLQRTSVYWATGHEATDTLPGVAVLT